MIILTGKTGSGKDTILNELCEKHGYERIVTTTTRPQRDGEVDGINYNFVDYEDFERMLFYDRFIEYRKYNVFENGEPRNWYYGTTKEPINDNSIIILDIQGAKKFIEYYGEENVIVFYLNVDEDILRERVSKRGDELLEFERRLESDNKIFTNEALSEINAIDIPYWKNVTIEEIVDVIIDYINYYDWDCIWGDNCADIYAMNNIAIVYNKKEKMYYLEIETAYLFENNVKNGECEYLRDLLKLFTQFINENEYDTKDSYIFFCSNCLLTNKAKTIEELYINFKIFVEGYCKAYDYKEEN